MIDKVISALEASGFTDSSVEVLNPPLESQSFSCEYRLIKRSGEFRSESASEVPETGFNFLQVLFGFRDPKPSLSGNFKLHGYAYTVIRTASFAWNSTRAALTLDNRIERTK